MDDQARFRLEAERCEAVLDILSKEPASLENQELQKTAEIFRNAFRLITDSQSLEANHD